MLFLWNEKKVREIVKLLFGVELTKEQEHIVRSVVYREHNRVIITCMTRYGKSFSVAIGICLWILMNENKKVCIIAPTNEKTTIIRNYIADLIIKCSALLDILDIDKTGPERIRKEVSKRRMTWKNEIEMRTLSAEGKGEQLMGFGADLLIVDEECDIDFEVYRSKITRMLGDNPDTVYIGIGNPWHRDNQMWEHWRNPNWLKIHIDYKIALQEGRATEQFIKEQKETLTDREFKILYEAEFPEESEDQLIKYSWIQHAMREFKIGTEKLVKRMGVDVARSGNDTTVLTHGIKTEEGMSIVREIKDYNQEDTMQTTARVLKVNDEVSFDEITIDTGGLGAGVTDRLNEIKKEGRLKAKLIAYQGGLSASTDKLKERFLNQKAEAYFHLRDLFEHGKIIIPKHAKLIDQLTKMKWEMTTSDKIRILDPGEGEKDTAEQKSPDFADSLCYFCWGGGQLPLSFGFIKFGK